MTKCTIPECDREQIARGFCTTHYWRFRKFGDPLKGGEIRESFKGGIRKHRLYGSWSGMINRCHNPNHSSYPRYGGAGIYVCASWREDFRNFLSDMGERPEGKTLDRIDPTGPYSPANCRWATASEQRRNLSADGDQRQREGARAGAHRRWNKGANI